MTEFKNQRVNVFLSSLDRTHPVMTEMQNDLLRLKADIETLRTSVESKDQELGHYRGIDMTLKDLEEKWRHSVNDHREDMKRLEVLRTDQETLTDSLDEAQCTLVRERETHAQERAEWKNQLEVAQETCQELNDTVVTQSKMVQEQHQEEQMLVAMLEKTKTDMEESLSKLKQTKADLEKTKTNMKGSQSELEMTKAELEKTKTDMEESQSKLQQTEAELKVQLEAVTVLLEHNANLKHVSESSSNQRELLREKLQAKTLTCDDLADALEVSESVFYETKVAHDDLCHTHETLELAYRSTCATSAKLELELEQLGREKKTLEGRCSRYTQELEELGTTLERHEKSLREKTHELTQVRKRAVVQDQVWQDRVKTLEGHWEDQKKELEKGLDVLRRKETMLREWKSYQHRLPVRREAPAHSKQEPSVVVRPDPAPPVVVNLSMLRELKFQNESLRQRLHRDAEEMEALDQHVKGMASEYNDMRNTIVKGCPRK